MGKRVFGGFAHLDARARGYENLAKSRLAIEDVTR
jgi:hypothetical protein